MGYIEITLSLLYYNGIGPLAAYVGLTLIALIIFLRNPKNQLNRIFAVMVTIAAFWNLAAYQIYSAADPQTATFYWRLYEILVFLLVPTWVYFATYFAGMSISPVLLYTPPLILAPFAIFTDLIIAPAIKQGDYFINATAPLLPVGNLFVLVYIVVGAYSLFTVYDGASGDDKKKNFPHVVGHHVRGSCGHRGHRPGLHGNIDFTGQSADRAFHRSADMEIVRSR